MDQKIQEARGKKPYAQPRVTSQELTLGVYGEYSGGETVMGFNDPGGTFSGSGGHRNSGSP